MFENRLPFIAAIVSNFIVVGITYIYLEDYFYLTVFVAVASIFIFSKQFNPWSLTAALLIALLPIASSKNDPTTYYLIWAIFIGGTILQIAASIVANRSTAPTTGSTLPLNTLFALLGVGFSYFLIFRIYQVRYGGSLANEVQPFIDQFQTMIGNEPTPLLETEQTSEIASIGQLWLSIIGCFAFYSLEPYLLYLTSGVSAIGPSLNAAAQSIGRAVLVGPLTWAAIFAAVNELRFRVFHFNELFKRFLAGFFSINRYGCLSFIVLISLSIGQTIYVNVLPPDPQIVDYFNLSIMVTVLTSLSLGTAYGVTRDK